MGRKAHKLTQKQFDAAFLLKNQGLNDRDVAEAIGISFNSYQKYKGEFLKAFAKKVRAERRTSESEAKKQKKASQQKHRESQIIKLSGLGLSIPKIAEIIGMPHRTIYQWLDNDEVLKHRVQVEAEKLNHKVLGKLLTNANGATEKVTKVVKHFDRTGKLTGLSEITTSKRIRPSNTAIQSWLINKADWKTTSGAAVTNSDADKVEYDVRERLYTEGED